MRRHHHRGAAHDVRWDFREGGKTLSTGAAPPNHRCVADSAARRIWWLCGTAPLKWSTPRLVLRRADAGVACFYLPFDLSAVDPQTPRFLHVARSLAEFLILLPTEVPSTLRRHVSYTWRGRCHLLGRGWEDPLPWRRTARLSFPTVAQWRHSGGQRLVSSCDGPVPALPARSSRSRHAAGDPQTSRFLHVARSPAPWRPSGVTFPTRGAVARPTPPTDGRPTYGAAPVGGLTTATRRWSRSRFR